MNSYSPLLLFLFTFLFSCEAQSQKRALVGGPCEGCDAIFEYGNKMLNDTDTLPGFLENEPKLKITGTVFKKDGKTPAKNVILYVYQTNRNGIYETMGGEKGWAKRHGHFRTWVKTNAKGQYTFYTFRPGAYPGRTEAEHIHLTVKEAGVNEYYLDDFVFDDDPLLTLDKRKQLPNRGGSGISVLQQKNGYFLIERNIILGLNIPNYD